VKKIVQIVSVAIPSTKLPSDVSRASMLMMLYFW
jgi:hypothetical protein